jgi:hypothetical protein
MDERHLVANFLRELARVIREMDNDEWSALRRAGFKVQVVVTKRGRPRHSKPSPIDVKQLAAGLRALDTTAAGMALLERECRTRAQLVELAKHLDLPAEKRDRVERLRERIVDATIGYRLRSMVIHGTKP